MENIYLWPQIKYLKGDVLFYFQDKTLSVFMLARCSFTSLLNPSVLLPRHALAGWDEGWNEAQGQPFRDVFQCRHRGGAKRPSFLGDPGGFTIGRKLAACFNCPSFSGRHLWNDYTPVKDSFYIIEDCPGSLSSESKKSHMNYLQSAKLFPFMSPDFVFVSAN